MLLLRREISYWCWNSNNLIAYIFSMILYPLLNSHLHFKLFDFIISWNLNNLIAYIFLRFYILCWIHTFISSHLILLLIKRTTHLWVYWYYKLDTYAWMLFHILRLLEIKFEFKKMAGLYLSRAYIVHMGFIL